MLFKSRGKVALISVHGDPAIDIGQEEAGGQNVYVKEVGEALARQGWQVDMFTRRSSGEQAEIVQHGQNCRTIRLTAGPQKFVPRQKIFHYLPEFLQAFLDFQHEQKTIYPLIHTNYWLSAWVGMELKKRQAIRHLHTYHSLGAVKYSSIDAIPLIARTRLRIERQCLETADTIIATSPQEKEHMRSLVSKKGNIIVIPCGTNIDCFGSVDRIAGRAKIGIKPEEKLVMYAGRFDKRKGIETLVRAVAQKEVKRHEKLKLMIIGGYTPGEKDGLEKERITSIVKELGIEDITVFAGKVRHEDLAYYYAAADVCVVPSYYEPFGLVAIEAMASRTPVVASKVGGLKFSVADGETGLLVAPQSETDFALAIDSILSDSQWREELGDNARTRVENKFSWDGVASQLDGEYLSELSNLYQELGLLVPAV
ncbi:glycosyltransferase family 1 protein [Waterburya agarophytonicola K14]|uniref:Glycosyltransferase family 1 protein n=1 Tax=Waterburya agarophytonicola KI4 TaxID=2874699 RepID=A0A964FHU0_9CYAN|nr:glycosyltransferase family 1 protein [Waterburya agarophytonicola]MCC0177899.1 glycosyltransferase family 1 protein [Waterburya agarophytonicola KI4]